jgi:type I restriction enzyme R subunit
MLEDGKVDKLPTHPLRRAKPVEKPLLDQLAGLSWEIIDLTKDQLTRDQRPADSHRENFTEVVMLPVLRERLKIINPWLEDDQAEDVVKQLTASFPSTGLLENNKHLFRLLLENTSVSENRRVARKPDGALCGL